MKKFDEFFNEQDNILENKRMDELRKKNAEMTARLNARNAKKDPEISKKIKNIWRQMEDIPKTYNGLPIKGESTKKWMKLKKEYDSLMDQQQKLMDKANESMIEIEIEDSNNEGVYVLTLHDIHNIVNQFTNDEVTENDILNELTNYKFIKVDNPEIEEINPDIESGDPDILFDPDKIKKFTEI